LAPKKEDRGSVGRAILPDLYLLLMSVDEFVCIILPASNPYPSYYRAAEYQAKMASEAVNGV